MTKTEIAAEINPPAMLGRERAARLLQELRAAYRNMAPQERQEIKSHLLKVAGALSVAEKQKETEC
ncbi:MAG: hypothetical protein JST79_15145 [Acidobacteria bacterium]|nr:hypothetical protein [Acidobacteriota bacterium]